LLRIFSINKKRRRILRALASLSKLVDALHGNLSNLSERH
jgi:hypothetical protein